MTDEPASAAAPPPRVVILTGLSGGGKTAAAKLYEDLAFTVVDNLPAELLGDLADLVASDPGRFARTAIVLDVRAGDVETAYRAMRGALEGRGIRPQVVYLEARDDSLIRRYSETRHRHPLAEGRAIAAAILEERRRLDPIRAEADLVLDTSDLPLRALRERLFARLGEDAPGRLALQLLSFGYKFGLPLEADFVLDARFLDNPYYVEELRERSGLEAPVRDHVLGQPEAARFLDLVEPLLRFSLAEFADEGRGRLTVAVGCTGGRHRSIVLVEALAERLQDAAGASVSVFHRDLDQP
jgi:UPF0042 nucleotide-binding protein